MDRKPNIVLIMFDHQLFYKHGFLDNRVKHPHFDNFIKESTFFENAFSVCPLCGPARRSIVNGLYPHKHGQVTNKLTEVKEKTYFDLLNKNGYENFYFGKWHAGIGKPLELFGCKGFSPESYNNPYLHDDYNDYLKRYNLSTPKGAIEFSESDIEYFKKDTVVELNGFHSLYTLTFGTLITPKETHECYYLATRACETLEELAKNPDKPFSLRVDFWGPHQPYFPTKEFLDLYDLDEIEIYPSFDDDLKNKPEIYKNENAVTLSKDHVIIYPNPQTKGNWKKMLKYAYAHNTMCDAAAGMIINKLKELNIYDNTIVIWSADHGDALGSHGGHIDKNCYLSEEVVRIPLAIHNPFCDNISVSKSIVSNLDIPATIADICGEKEYFEDSVSLNDYLESNKEGRPYFVIETHGHFQKHFGRAVCYKNYRYIYNEGMVDELYDMEQDPYQMNNLINDLKYKDIKEKLIGYLKEWQAKTNDKII